MSKAKALSEFSSAAESVLESKGIASNHPALKELIQAIEYDQASVQRKIFWYKWPGVVLLVAIPLISALVSIAVAAGEKKPPSVWYNLLPQLSVSLTILTIFDSAFRPAIRFKRICSLGIEIQEFKGQLLMGLQAVSTEAELTEYLGKKRHELTQFSLALVDLFMPETVAVAKTGPEKTTRGKNK